MVVASYIIQLQSVFNLKVMGNSVAFQQYMWDEACLKAPCKWFIGLCKYLWCFVLWGRTDWFSWEHCVTSVQFTSSITWCKGNCLILFLSRTNSEAFFLPLFSSLWYLQNLSNFSLHEGNLFNQIVETIIFMLLNGLFPNNISLSWGTELHLRTKQAISHGEDWCFHCHLFLGCFLLQWYVAASLCLYI